MILEIQGEDDMTLLPPIDISESKKKIIDYKKRIDEGLEQFSNKVDVLKDIALKQSDELDQQNKMIGDMSQNIEKKKGTLNEFRKELEAIEKHVDITTKLFVLFILLIILVILATIIFVYLVVTIGFGL